MPSLFVISGRDQGTRFELTDETIFLGRDSANTIQLNDTEASRRHAELRRRDGIYVLTDLTSSNGTFVNGRRVESCELASGDRVQFGRSLLLYTATGDRSASDLSGEVDIVARGEQGDGSRIVHVVSQREGAEAFGVSVDDAPSPWLARARSNLQIMYRTALAVSHTLDIDQLLDRIMEMIFEWVEADRGCIMLFDPETRVLAPKARRERRPTKNRDEKIQISRTILDYVSEKKEGVLTSNAREDERWDTGKSILQMGVREAICVPMQGRYDIVGVIYIDTSITPQQMLLQGGFSNKFNEEHLKLMIAIAHQAALAVEDTNYYKAMVQAERLAAVGQTVATLSHHVKNVLQGIRGGSYLIDLGITEFRRHSAPPEPNLEKITSAMATLEKGWRIVEKNQEKISTLMLDMLTFSKERDPEPAPADINEIVRDVVDIVRPRSTDLGVAIDTVFASPMPTLLFDPDGLHRAVLNIVTNAVDASDVAEQARVVVTTEYDAEKRLVRVVVDDNGVGIAEEEIEQIFKLFVSKKGGRGTGLGLPVSQKIVKEHGGHIRVQSEPGHGSRFTLEWPALLPGEATAEGDSHLRTDTISLEELRAELDRERRHTGSTESIQRK